MRRFFRVAITPPTLHEDRIKKVAEKNIDAHEKDKKKEFDHHLWAEPDVQGLLYATFGPVCAYCGADLSRTPGVVDHYRPQGAVHEDKNHSGYWWLAYAFDNYVLSCGTCNGSSYKGTKFPLLHGTHVTFDKKEALATEARALLHPCEDDIDRALWVDIDKTLLPVCKGSDLEEPLASRVDKFLDTFGRFQRYSYLYGRKEVYNRVLDWRESGKIAMIRRAASRYSPYSQVARSVLVAEKAQLPTNEEELEWLTEDFIQKLDHYLKLAVEDAYELQRPRAKRDMDAMGYALAALLLAPPHGSSDTVRQVLKRNDLLEEIQKYVDKLRKTHADRQILAQDSSRSESI